MFDHSSGLPRPSPSSVERRSTYGRDVDAAQIEALRRALAADQTIDIVTVGARSGLPRRTEIWFTKIGDEIFITGTPADDGTTAPRRKRDWLANLAANPTFDFVLKESVSAVLPARAEVVTDRGVRERVFSAPEARWYLEQTGSMSRLVDEAPLVRVTFTGEAAPLNGA